MDAFDKFMIGVWRCGQITAGLAFVIGAWFIHPIVGVIAAFLGLFALSALLG